MSDEETKFLQRVIDAHPAKFRKLKLTIANWALAWCIYMLLLVVGWLMVSWVVRKTSDIEIGWDNSIAALWVVSVGGIACLVFSIISTARWVRGWNDNREPLQADIANQRVSDEEYEFIEAIRMQEPEHLGLMYFMRQNDGTAFVFFDRESQDLSVQGENPQSSSFVPRKRLCVTRTPDSGVVISTEFSGDALKSGDPIELMAPPEEWPEHAEIGKVPWDKLLETYAG